MGAVAHNVANAAPHAPCIRRRIERLTFATRRSKNAGGPRISLALPKRRR